MAKPLTLAEQHVAEQDEFERESAACAAEYAYLDTEEGRLEWETRCDKEWEALQDRG